MSGVAPPGLARLGYRLVLALGLPAAVCLVGCGAPAALQTRTAEDGSTIIERAAALDALGRVDRLVDGFYLAHPDAEAMKARARGEAVSGPPAPEGLALHGVQPHSWVGQLGLREGDILQRLDDSPTDTPSALMAAAWRLRGRLSEEADWRFEAEIVRDGRPLTLRYVVRNSP